MGELTGGTLPLSLGSEAQLSPERPDCCQKRGCIPKFDTSRQAVRFLFVDAGVSFCSRRRLQGFPTALILHIRVPNITSGNTDWRLGGAALCCHLSNLPTGAGSKCPVKLRPKSTSCPGSLRQDSVSKLVEEAVDLCF